MNLSWEIKNLGEVASISAGNSAPQNEKLFKDGIYPFIRTSDVGQIRKGFISSCVDYLNSNGIKGLKLFKKGTILFPKSGASTFLNHRVMMEIDGFVSSHLATIKANNLILDDKFALYYLITIDARDLMQDIAYPSLKTSDIGQIQIPLPPLAEQKRIVSLLDEAFAEIAKAKANAEQNLKNSQEMFESYLQGVFESKGEDWEEKTLGEILSKQPQNGWSPVGNDDESKGTPVLTLSSVTGFQFRPEKVKYTSVEVDQSKNYWVNNGDLLITRSNTLDLVGHVAIASGIEKPTIYPDLIMRMTPNDSVIDIHFLYNLLKSFSYREKIKSLAHGASSTMKKITKVDVQSLPISFPKFKTQKAIVLKIDTLSYEVKKLEEIYQKKLNDLEELKKSILQKAFNGELTAD